MKIIDAHVHIGSIMEWDFKKETTIMALEKYNINYAIVSNVLGCEFDNDLRKFPDEEQIDQISLNNEIIKLCLEMPNKFKGLFWIKPHTEGYSYSIEEYISNNSNYFCGMKVHPYNSKLKFIKENYKDYLDMCKRLKLPVEVHTADDGYSNPSYVYETAKDYPDVKFIMVHMGARTNHNESIRFIRELPNLFGDTSLVDVNSILRAIKECGSEKILFGTDSPALGIDTYKRYEDLMNPSGIDLSQMDLENLFFNNAVKVFNLNM